ncbi:MAG: Uma2 family endonuclease, partial [Prochloron sp. SP5CPC1]|nr:Uma2 family endonuclease [Candidatus Paraprochloron terpiosi SP5CPC1]
PERGAEAPDWFYVPNVPPMLKGQIRRSYVLWQELRPPLIAIELASGNGTEERDKTPLSLWEEGKRTKPGKFWVYEQMIRIPYYGIYEIKTGQLAVYHLQDLTYQQLEPNDRGHYLIAPLKVELGLWRGTYQNQTQLWLRWWDEQGNLLLIGEERVELEKQRTAQEKQRTAQEKQRAERAERRAHLLAERLKAMGVDLNEEELK